MRSIVHLDADAFFASVEQASDPRLRGKPVAVGGDKRGIIASASYEARKWGIYTPMPTARARKLCPKLILLPGDFEKYEQFSRWMFSYAQDFTPEVEINSIDEGYFDLSGVGKSPVEVAETIRRAIYQSLKISVSEGIGSNKLISQIASKLKKPAGFLTVPFGQEFAFLTPLKNYWLPGIGAKTSAQFDLAGLALIGQIAVAPMELLSLLAGNQAQQLQNFARGKDDRPVETAISEAKSYSQQETFLEDLMDEEWVELVLRKMADDLMTKVREDGKSIRTVTVKVRYNDRAEDQRSESLLEPTDLETDLYGRLKILLKQAWKRRVSLRMVSLRFSSVYDRFWENALPMGDELRRRNERRLAEALDGLRGKGGRYVVMRGHDLMLREKTVAAYGRATRQENGGIKPARIPTTGRSWGPLTYVPLNFHSYYSFLDSTLSPEQIIQLAVRHGLKAVAMTDPNLHGVVKFCQAAYAARIQPIIGAEIRERGSAISLYVQNQEGYRNLCHILSHGGELRKSPTEGLIAVSVDPSLAALFEGRFYLGIEDLKSFEKAREWTSVPKVAFRPVHYASVEEKSIYEVIQCIRTLTRMHQLHPEKRVGEFHFLDGAGMNRQFEGCEELLSNTVEIAGRCSFELKGEKPRCPQFIQGVANSLDGDAYSLLKKLVMEGMRVCYPQGADVEPQILQELRIIRDVGYEEYFLVVWDLLQECRKRNIPWITRGSAADSLVCYCLGISHVCPRRFRLDFRRFLNLERMSLHKLPDIDVDFPHDRKDDVVDLVFEKYGREHVAMVGGFSTYRARSAFADVAKVFGLSEHQVRQFTTKLPYLSLEGYEAKFSGLHECVDLPWKEEPYAQALKMAQQMAGFPRHPKMHPCGLVISREPISGKVPCFISEKGYPTTHFDMDDVEAIGLVKMDILAQGGLAVIRDVEAALAHRGISIPWKQVNQWNDSAVWEMISRGEARAVHHIESPAMVNLSRMCNVHDIDGLVAIVSVIRPGAANENKKQHFVRRYQGMEPVTYPHPSLESCLEDTYGMVVYEEHILQVCEAFAGLTAGRADVLRRALSKEKHSIIEEIRREFVVSARKFERAEEDIEKVWKLVSGFTGYAFCKAHSAAYGVEAYESAWLKKYYPAEFMAAVLSNGKGFYHPIVYILECHRLGIPLWAPCVNEPGPMFQVNARGEIRVPVFQVKGMTRQTLARMLKERNLGKFRSLKDFVLRVDPLREEMELLLRSGALDGFGESRARLFWEVQMLFQDRMGSGQDWLLPPTSINSMSGLSLSESDRLTRLRAEDELLGFVVSGHPLELHPDIDWHSYCKVGDLSRHGGEVVTCCGLIIEDRVHSTVTGELMKFMTLADWTGIVETELFAPTYRSEGLATLRYPVLEVTARVEPYENGKGYTLRILRAGRPRGKKEG